MQAVLQQVGVASESATMKSSFSMFLLISNLYYTVHTVQPTSAYSTPATASISKLLHVELSVRVLEQFKSHICTARSSNAHLLEKGTVRGDYARAAYRGYCKLPAARFGLRTFFILVAK